ncbi:MAG: hypothetical protein GX094_10805 [Clostridiales bacterium]|jgi:hypothetical protein|nr:hypothetical protein [Clostridiales bacterium]
MREEQEITKEKFLERKEARERNIIKLKQEVRELQERISQREQSTNKKKLENIREFRKKWNKSKSVKEKNQFLHIIIDRLEYKREGDNINIKINFH